MNTTTATLADAPDTGRPPAGRANLPRVVQGVSALTILACVILLVRLLPVDAFVEALEARVESLGLWGPGVFAAAYAVATVLFIPGSALTLAAGAVFGLVRGTITVSIGSTTGAALAFLIARYFARRRIEALTRSNPRFAAIDRAIGEQGWKIVALLRLSPLVPFNLSNYFYGLTAIRFWPYVLASWLAMLPGTFMYVYLGYIGREAAAGSGAGLGQWVLRIVGLLATVAVTVYVTRLARRALAQSGALEADTDTRTPEPAAADRPAPPRWTRGTLITAAVAVALAGATAYAYVHGVSFGPPAVTLQEAYAARPDGPHVDHSRFDRVLKKYVDADGWVDYAALKRDSGDLDAYIASLAEVPFEQLGRDEKLALLINAYNAFTLRLILDHYPLRSIRDIPASKRWDARRWNVGGHVWSLNDIEHKQIRPKFREPRIHFALVCAAIGCPKLRNEAYDPARLDAQLENQTRYVHTHDRWFRYDAAANAVHLTKLYQWYGNDFRQVAGSVLDFAARYSPPLAEALGTGRRPKIRWLEYDWTLNDVKNR